MKILFYTPFNLRSRDTETLMQAFLKQKHEVLLLTQSEKGIYHEKCSSLGVKSYAYVANKKYKYLFILKHFIYLINFCRKNKIDIIYAHLENASMIAVLAQYFIKAKVISCRHVTEEPHLLNSKKYLSQIKLVNKLSKMIIVVSQQCKDFMVTVEHVNPSKIKVINLSYNFALYDPINFEKVNLINGNTGGSVLKFIMASRFIDNKKPFTALELIKKLKEDGLQVKLIILGSGPLEQEIKNWISKNNLENEISLHGYVDNVLDYFAASDILLIPSITESSSVVLKEAGLAKITSIICKNVGDAESYLTNEDVFFVNKENFVLEARKIAIAHVSKPDILKAMGQNLHKKVLERFSIDNNLSHYDSINSTKKIELIPRVAFVSSHIHTSLQFEWFEEELFKQNIYNIHVIINTLENEVPLLHTELIKLGIKSYLLNYKNRLSLFTLLFSLRKILKENKINIIHTTLPYGNLIGQLAALSLGIKARVTTCENASWAFDYNSRKQKIIDRFTFLSAKKVISVADTANDFLLNTWKIKPSNLVQINHSLKFIEYESVTSERINKIKTELNIKPEDFTMGMIARTEFWKGHQYAVEAMAEVVKLYPNIKLLICGSVGFDHQKLLDLISDYKLENNVKFIGFVNDTIAFLKVIKVQIHIPINKYVENCGISIIEGMAAKTPQLLTLSGYSYQSAKHLKNAYVVDYCNSKEVAQGIIYLYTNYDKAIAFGEQAYKDALDQYTTNVKYNKHMQVYNELLNN
ncbi:MAG: glycosyltransferase [Bacteroidia bacterium]|nr:glycosyltransferase [Bacteroidia bacterium]